MKVWIARNGERLALFAEKPRNILLDSTFEIKYNINPPILIDKNDPLGDGITFENSPQEVELVRG